MTRKSQADSEPIRGSIWIVVFILTAVIIALLVIPSKPAKDDTDQKNHSGVSVGESASNAEPAGAVHPPLSSKPFALAVESRPKVEPSEKARQLVQAMSQIDVRPGQLTPEKAEKWKRSMEELIEEGRGAVPVLREYFQTGQNVRFDNNSGTNLLGESTLRMAFMKVLFDVPTPDNVELQEEVLRTTTDPDEVALLARQLELQEPGTYRGLIIKSIKSTIMKAKNGEYPGRDVTPLFEILAQYGITSVQ